MYVFDPYRAFKSYVISEKLTIYGLNLTKMVGVDTIFYDNWNQLNCFIFAVE